MYNKKIISNFSNPKNAGLIRGANATSKVNDIENGDIIKFYFLVNNETEILEEVKFKAFGGPVTIAAANIACEMIKDKTLNEVLQIKDFEINNALNNVPLNKIYVTILIEEAIKATVQDYYIRLEKANQEKEKTS
jgi:NifU-like protein involved in Fe-S cluster formation